MEKFYILDTCSFYSYCCRYLNIFTDKEISMQEDSLKKLNDAFKNKNIKIVIPSVILIEIFDHYFNNDEFINRFKYEVYSKILSEEDNNKIAIIDVDTEVLENLFNCYTDDVAVDLHDKLIMATALKYKDKNTTLFTSDRRVRKIISKNNLPLKILS